MSVRAPARRKSWHDAYDAQMALWRWYRGDEGHAYLLNHARMNIEPLEYEATKEILLKQYSAEDWRLLSCDPIFVSREMCEVIDFAQETFEPEPLLETDLLTPRGFVFFEKPFDVMDRFDAPTTVAAFSWVRLYQSADDATAQIVSEILDHHGKGPPSAAEVDERIESVAGVEPAGLSLTLYALSAPHLEDLKWMRGEVPPVLPMHLTPWYFNMEFNPFEEDAQGFETGAMWWWRILQSTFRLMQQRIAVKHIERPDRNQRRLAKSYGVKEPEVVVVRLRREASETGEPTGEEANYSHRFIVSGHWRNQPYPKEGIYRQIWISPYVKGPEDKPLIVRPRRVYTWDR